MSAVAPRSPTPALHIEALRLAPPLLLAPMAGFTNAPTRRIAHRFGATLSFTEMVNAAGLIHASGKSWQLLETFPDEGPVVAHLYGHEPRAFAAAATEIARTGRFAAFDVNAGCPVRKITRSGAGAALMNRPEVLGDIVTAIRDVSDLPVMVKTRLGPHPGNITVFKVLEAVSAAGAAALTLHARFASSEHAGNPDLALLREVKCRGPIPVIGNGGIRSADDALRMLEQTGVDAVMIGRAAIGNPWVLREVAAAMQGLPLPPMASLDERREVLFEHLESEIAHLRALASRYPLPKRRLTPDAAAVIGFRCHFFRYLAGLKGVTWLRGQIGSLNDLDDVRHVVDTCLAREAAYRAARPK